MLAKAFYEYILELHTERIIQVGYDGGTRYCAGYYLISIEAAFRKGVVKTGGNAEILSSFH